MWILSFPFLSGKSPFLGREWGFLLKIRGVRMKIGGGEGSDSPPFIDGKNQPPFSSLSLFPQF
jgi:hypothetical protein